MAASLARLFSARNASAVLSAWARVRRSMEYSLSPLIERGADLIGDCMKDPEREAARGDRSCHCIPFRIAYYLFLMRPLVCAGDVRKTHETPKASSSSSSSCQAALIQTFVEPPLDCLNCVPLLSSTIAGPVSALNPQGSDIFSQKAGSTAETTGSYYG